MASDTSYLECPVCGDECQAFPAHEPTVDFPEPHWFDDDDGVCQCGAKLKISADGEQAWLVEMESDK